jgi:hypothetical protein
MYNIYTFEIIPISTPSTPAVEPNQPYIQRTWYMYVKSELK